MADQVIAIAGLRKVFGDFVAVDGISFSVEQGEIFGFIGPNGSGKSTTIRMLLGLLTPTAGGGTVMGFDIARESEAIRQRIGYMAQKFSLYDELTAGENIRFYAGIYGLAGAKAKQHIDDALSLVGLVGIDKIPAGSLSTGWRQRLGLACALVHRPRLLFLDEPTGGVDPVARREFWDLLYSLASTGVTIFVTTHYMDEADHCHHLALINAGRIVAYGTPGQIKAKAGTRDLEVIFARMVEAERDQGGASQQVADQPAGGAAK
ncbi:MAG TPA: ABC transporter ATP-binding protein [Symbiobacteriaceae bacterium]|jgi:ABC-2 type transport system ATP-binding protein